jgi:hypothetical protein
MATLPLVKFVAPEPRGFARRVGNGLVDAPDIPGLQRGRRSLRLDSVGIALQDKHFIILTSAVAGCEIKAALRFSVGSLATDRFSSSEPNCYATRSHRPSAECMILPARSSSSTRRPAGKLLARPSRSCGDTAAGRSSTRKCADAASGTQHWSASQARELEGGLQAQGPFPFVPPTRAMLSIDHGWISALCNQ